MMDEKPLGTCKRIVAPAGAPIRGGRGWNEVKPWEAKRLQALVPSAGSKPGTGPLDLGRPGPTALSPKPARGGFWWALVGLALVGLLGNGCAQPAPPEVVRPVRTIVLGDYSPLARGSIPGRAQAAIQVNMAFRVGGPLVERPIRMGQEVKQGQLLARIDPTDFRVELDSAEAALARAEAELEKMQRGARPEELEQLRAAVASATAAYEQARNDYDRYAQAAASRAITQQELDMAIRRLKQRDAELRQAQEELAIGERGAREEDIAAKMAELLALRADRQAAANRLEYTELRAPFAGRVTTIFVENFETAHPQQPICRLVDIAHMEVLVDVPESVLPLIPHVTELWCTFREVPDERFAARVTEVGIEPSPVTRTYPVKLTVDNSKGLIMPGMTADVSGEGKLPEDTAERGFVVPESALCARDDGGTIVWVVDEKTMTVHARPVVPGEITTGGIRVQGLKPGERVVTAGVHMLREGQKVRLFEPEGTPDGGPASKLASTPAAAPASSPDSTQEAPGS